MSFDADMFDRYLRFVEDRHCIWEQRQAGLPAPWTDDPILASRKFTNVFRILDPGSQFVLSDLAEPDGSRKDILMRLFLYRHTGRVEAWRHLRHTIGDYPTLETLEEARGAWKEYRRHPGGAVFTGAYLVYPQSAVPGTDKLDSIIDLTERLFTREGLAEEFFAAETQRDKFAALRRHKGVADFMSMQILTDWGYTPFGEDRENEFVVPGPGCKKGIATITDTRDHVGFLRFAHEEVLASESCPVIDLGYIVRYPTIMDIQNTLCEFSKYARYLKAGKAGTPYSPAHPGKQSEPHLPAHWTTSTR